LQKKCTSVGFVTHAVTKVVHMLKFNGTYHTTFAHLLVTRKAGHFLPIFYTIMINAFSFSDLKVSVPKLLNHGCVLGDEYMCMCVYVSPREHLRSCTPNHLTSFSVHVACGHGWVIIRQCCDMSWYFTFLFLWMMP